LKVQDLAKSFNISTRDLLSFLREQNIKAKSGSTKLDPGTISKIKSLYTAAKENEKNRKEFTAAPESITITEESVKVSELVDRFKISLPEIMKVFLKMGLLLNVNSDIDRDTIKAIAEHFNITIHFDDQIEEQQIGLKTRVMEIEEEGLAQEGEVIERPPVITIMGHVDHGKTKLLDTIRQANVVDKEAGGITQHIGAYQVEANGKKLTFLDTPGHEAFTSLRARGAQVTDITILVVAADEGIKPQTIEAINHAQAADVPIVVAINKIDKPNADPERVKTELSQHNLVAEDWGGKTIMVPISAKTGDGIPELLEMLALVSEMLELKANASEKAKAVIIESNLSKQKGAIASILVKTGTLRIGDFFVVDTYNGKVRAMFNDHGKQVTEAGPGTPVEILGLPGVPDPGSILESKATEKECKEIAQERVLQEKSAQSQAVSLESLSAQIEEGNVRQLNLIIKADVTGSLEAIKASIAKVESRDIPIRILHASTGTINENDVMLGRASAALILGFGVDINSEAQKLADTDNISVKTYSIIYEMLDDIERVVKGLYKPEFVEEETSTIEVRQLFKFSKVGTIAGCYVTSGKVTRHNQARVFRNGKEIYEGKVESLKRFKDDVRDVSSGYECGVVLDNFNDLAEGDQIITFVVKEKKVV